jgi:hypothetical protein
MTSKTKVLKLTSSVNVYDTSFKKLFSWGSSMLTKKTQSQAKILDKKVATKRSRILLFLNISSPNQLKVYAGTRNCG